MMFPVYLRIGPLKLPPHPVLETLAYTLGYAAYRGARRRGDFLDDGPRWMLLAAAALGAVVGSRLMAWIADPAGFEAQTWGSLWQAKTVVGGLIGGTLAVEWCKTRLGITERTGDPMASALALAIGIGRLGCFLTGVSDHTYGNPSSMPWAMDMGDGVLRHPVALYESLYCVALAYVLRRLEGRLPAKGDLFRVFMLSYFAWRFLVEFIKPGPCLAGLNGYQWASLAVCLGYWRDARRLLSVSKVSYA
jgi:prolipoprotein diacylglyceryltransferase